MTTPRALVFTSPDLDALGTAEGHIALVLDPDGKLDPAARRINKLTRGALQRLLDSDVWTKAKTGTVTTLAFPAGLMAQAVHLAKLPRKASASETRKTGAALARAIGAKPAHIVATQVKSLGDLALGLQLRGYAFSDHKSETPDALAPATLVVGDVAAAQAELAPVQALAAGVFLTRDLVNEPANVLTTTEFANRLAALRDLGVEVEILEEDRLADLKMGALLAVGQGSASPSKVVVMRWSGGPAAAAPLALIGKGVVFDTGGISLKPAAGMEDMTMDMGGAGVVAGVMKALALRGAKANVVGLVGLVENMPSGTATRPGDVVTTMKGDTVEVINTDAEGRLVLCDVMWYAQETYKPAAMVDLATLTGACIIALGHENAGVFSNDDPFCKALLGAAGAEDEGAWRMPLGQAYDDLLKSPVADMKNIGGRAAGAVTAAQFLQRFVQPGLPWAHLDIAGVAHVATDRTLSPKGATGWGVLTLNRLIAQRFESD